MLRRTRILYAVLVYIFIFAALTLNISNNLIVLYSDPGDFCSRAIGQSTNDVRKGDTNRIPRHIHQMFFNVTDKTIPKRLEDARQTWLFHHSGYNYTLWNEEMVFNLIKDKYSELIPLYKSYSHWVRRADVGRYVILNEHGGLYVDLDIGVDRNVEPLLTSFKNTTDVVLYYTKPVGVSNDFMISKPRHQFFKHVLCGLDVGNRWYILPYLTTLMTTGPGYLYGKYKTFEQQQQIHVVEESVLKPFLRHKKGGAWHGTDGKVIWWIYIHRHFLLKCTIMFICSCTILFVLRLFKSSVLEYYGCLLGKVRQFNINSTRKRNR